VKRRSKRAAATDERTAERQVDRLRRLEENDSRIRLSLRLMPSVDKKLDDLARFRALDRNTAISVAIVQDWLACFGNGNRPPPKPDGERKPA
jgi:hypothetical protein